MKKITYFAAIALFTASAFSLTSCKKGKDDPILSLKSRTARVTNTWDLEEYRENGATQDMGDVSMTWEFDDNGNLTETREGDIFGVQTVETREGSWAFVTDKEELKVVFDGESNTYILDRLSSKDLWVRDIDGTDVDELIFEVK